jgi:outer membrane protein TolC
MTSPNVLRNAGRLVARITIGATVVAGIGGIATADTAPVVGIPSTPGEEAEILTLDRCLERALADNLDLQRERLREREISGLGLQAMATGLPTLDLVGTWTRSRDPSFLLDDSFGGGGGDAGDPFAGTALEGVDFTGLFPSPDELEAQTFWTGNLSSNWELNPFRVWNAMGGVDETRRQFEADVESAEHRVADETIRTFHEAVLHQETIAALDAEIEARGEFLDITRRRFELEMATELDTLQAAVALANLRPERRGARTNLRNATSRLNLLMGREPREPLTLLPVDDLETDPLPAGLAAADVSRRPDLVSATAAIDFLRKRRGVERADTKPFLSANGTYGWVARDLDGLTGRDYESWRASVSLILPVFDGFSVRGRSRELDARILAARRGLEDAQRRARLEIATTVEELEAARENHAAARLNLKAADRALEQTTRRYELGQTEYLSVLNAQSDRFAARSHLIEARYEVLAGTARLKRALGFHPSTPLSRIREDLEGSTP